MNDADVGVEPCMATLFLKLIPAHCHMGRSGGGVTGYNSNMDITHSKGEFILSFTLVLLSSFKSVHL